MTKCPYVPPHEWNVDYPHLMLRAKAVKFKKGEVKLRDKILTSTDAVGRIAGIPVIAQMVNVANKNTAARKLLSKTLGVHPDATLPPYHSNTLRQRLNRQPLASKEAKPTQNTRGKVVLFATCYSNRNEPQIGEDLVAVFEHNNLPVVLLDKEQCCGMPKMELGDLTTIEQAKNANISELKKWVDQGWDIVAPIPSCVLMFKQELPLLFPDDQAVQDVRAHTYDPFEYLMLRHKDGELNTTLFRIPKLKPSSDVLGITVPMQLKMSFTKPQ